ncbi:MAG: hypothetical protein KatS3mg087_2142 [Patescibacteria group bacterium]|nr:MAG: hypothetical protein KatS3mg087_2142 [Patescibacteria group bacterium]
MKDSLGLSLFILLLVVLVFGSSLFPQSLFSMAAEQVLYPPPEAANNALELDPYPPPSLPSQPFPYPPPVSTGNIPSDNGSVHIKEALLADAETYASMYGVSIDEATKRLTLQDIVEELNANLVTNENTTFAGLWIQHESEYRVIARFTSNGSATIKSYIQNTPLYDLVEVRIADINLEELKLEQLQATQIMNQSNFPFRTGINVMENRVEVYVLDTEEVSTFFRDSNIVLPEHTHIIKVNEIGKEGHRYLWWTCVNDLYERILCG